MKIKILLAGNNASRDQFLQSLGSQVTFKQAGASVNVIGTGTYTFRLGEDDIEILYIEDCDILQKNYKAYAVGAKAIILLDADEATEKLLIAACPMLTPVSKNTPGKAIDGMVGVKHAVKKCYARQAKLSSNPHTQFTPQKPAPAPAQQPATGQGVDLDKLKLFLAERTPARK